MSAMCTPVISYQHSGYFPGSCTYEVRIQMFFSTPTLESPSRGSFSTFIAFLDARPSLVDMIQGVTLSVWLSQFCFPCIPRSPTTSSVAAMCIVPTYFVHIQVPGTCRICILYLAYLNQVPEPFPAFISQIDAMYYFLLNSAGLSRQFYEQHKKEREICTLIHAYRDCPVKNIPDNQLVRNVAYFLRSGRVLVVLGLVVNVLFAFSCKYQQPAAVLTFFSQILGRGGAALLVRLTRTGSRLGIHTTTVVQYDTNVLPRRMVGPTRDNIRATAGSITWNLHHRSNIDAGPISIDIRLRVQTPSNGSIERSQRDLPTPPFSLRIPPPPSLFCTKAFQTLGSCKQKLRTGMRDRHTPSRYRH